ncbi:MAG: SPOR domain-containing protein [Candidatus Omnitrophota bacterium]
MFKKIIPAFAFLLLAGNAYCMSLSQAKAYFIKGDYKSAVSEGERILAGYTGHHDNLDELYYILGLAYLKDGNYLRASDIFEIILEEFRNSSFKDEARLGLGDSYFLRGDYVKAQSCYELLLKSSPGTKLKPLIYYRFSQVGIKGGDTRQAKEYLDKLKTDFPYSPETRLYDDLYAFTDIYYTVQVGSFVNLANARNLCDKLTGRGYDAYFEEADMNGTKTYRVKVGKLKSRQDAIDLKSRLSSDGYPTKIIP